MSVLQVVEVAALSTAALLQVGVLLTTAARANRRQAAPPAQAASKTARSGTQLAPAAAEQQTQLMVAQEVAAELAHSMPAPAALAPLQGFVVVVAIMCNAILRRLQGVRCARCRGRGPLPSLHRRPLIERHL